MAARHPEKRARGNRHLWYPTHTVAGQKEGFDVSAAQMLGEQHQHRGRRKQRELLERCANIALYEEWQTLGVITTKEARVRQ